jgi:hypothetical protein
MSRADLREGIRWLSNKLYHPDRFGERVLGYLDRLRCDDRGVGAFHHRREMRSVDRDTLALIAGIPKLDAPSARMWERVMARLPEKPGAAVPLMEAMVRYAQLRFMYEAAGFWDGAEPADAFSVGTPVRGR